MDPADNSSGRDPPTSGAVVITITPATLPDAEAISALLKECWAATYSSLLSVGALERVAQEWHHPDILRRQIPKSNALFFVARAEDGALVGAANGKISPDQDAMDLQRLYVHPAYQRRGIGSRLLRRVLSAVPTVKRVELEVAEANRPGRAFWIEHGFQEIGRTRVNAGGVPLELVRMRTQEFR